jgi:hypothetical protein
MAVNKHRVRSHGGGVVTDGLAIVSFTLVMWTMCKDIHRSGKGSAERRTGRSAITASCSFPSSFQRLYSFDL